MLGRNNFLYCSSCNHKMMIYRPNIWRSSWNIAPNIRTSLHHIMVAATGAPNIGSTQHKILNCVVYHRWGKQYKTICVCNCFISIRVGNVIALKRDLKYLVRVGSSCCKRLFNTKASIEDFEFWNMFYLGYFWRGHIIAKLKDRQ